MEYIKKDQMQHLVQFGHYHEQDRDMKLLRSLGTFYRSVEDNAHSISNERFIAHTMCPQFTVQRLCFEPD